MKTNLNSRLYRQFLCALLLLSALVLPIANRAYAGFTLEMNVIRYHQYGYYFFPNLITNGVNDLPYGDYYITSYGVPTNGSSSFYHFDATGFNQQGGGDYGYGDFNGMMHELTNGTWFIYVTNTVTTNVYHFKVTANITSNDFPYVDITYPVDGSQNVPNQPTFTWQNGPTNYGDLIVYQGNNSALLPVTQTSWQPPAMADGPNGFTPHYDSNSTTSVVSSQPVDSGSHPISSWNSTDHLQDYATSQFFVGNLDGGGTTHTLVAYYPFDSTSPNALDGGTDASGNGYDMSFGGSTGAEGGANLTTDSEAGIGAMQFHDGDGNSAGYLGWSNPTPPALLNALAGSFSVSCWIKTTQNNLGWDNAPAVYGAGIVSADVAGVVNDTIPIALTGSTIGFNTGGDEDDTLNSSRNGLNDGNYHHIVVTRNQQTGQKIIYIDGMLDTYGSGTTNLLNDPQTLTIGAFGDAGNPDPSAVGYYNGFDGEVDDLQIYSGVLSSNDVTSLYYNPGTTIANGGGTFGSALGTTNLNWSTSGDSSWFVENNYTYNGAPAAAQSGPVVNYQTSTLSVTVTGPGTLTFAWACQASGDFDYVFDIDGNYADDIAGDWDWYQETDPNTGQPFVIPPGQHTLTWTANAYDDNDPTEAAFLDAVSFVPQTAPTIPVITLNPFNQTNYPGYSVWLNAAVATNQAVTWQWYEVGVGAISGATSASYIPTNSGTAGVAGSYYAVATDDAGSANSTTAAVAFVTAALPPTWSIAFKSPFEAYDDSQATHDYYYGCCLDGSGNIYAAVEFGGNMTVTTTNNVTVNLITGTNGDAAAIVKQTPTGPALWVVGITNNGTGSSYAECVAPHPDGGAYLGGNYNGNNWLGTNRLVDAGSGDMFVARFTPNGSNLWVKTFGGTNSDFLIINSLASDPSGNVTFSGLVGAGSVTIGTSNYMVPINTQQGIIVQLDQNGAVRWSQLLPPEWMQYLIYSGGRLYGSLNTQVANNSTNVTIGGVVYPTDRTWAVVCLNDTNGQPIWVRGVGTQSGVGSGNPYSTGAIDDVPRLAVYGTNLFVTGVAYGPNASFGNVTINFPDLRDQYFARLDTNGNAYVATSYGSVTTSPIAAAANASGVYVDGSFDEYSFFGNRMIAAPENYRPFVGDFSQSFVAKFDFNGNPLWANVAVSPTNVDFLGIAAANDGVWVSGWGQAGDPPLFGPIKFGTNSVYTDRQFLSGPAGGGTLALLYQAGVLGKITDTLAAFPVTLINATNSGANFQFQFLSESGFSHSILYRTNLVVGNWQTNSTVSGDGTLKTISLPRSLFSPSQQGFIRVTTQ